MTIRDIVIALAIIAPLSAAYLLGFTAGFAACAPPAGTLTVNKILQGM